MDSTPTPDVPMPPSAPVAPPPVAAGPTHTPRGFSWRDFFIGVVTGLFSAAVLILILVMAAVAFVNEAVKSDSAGESSAFAATGPVPEFPEGSKHPVYGQADFSWTFKRLDGTPAHLSDYKGKVIFVNFWATWCGPCVSEMPSIQALQEKMKDDQIAFVLVSDEESKKIEQFIEKKKWSLTSFRIDLDPPALFKTSGIPATFIVDREGQVVLRHIGSAKWDHESTVKFLRRLTATQ